MAIEVRWRRGTAEQHESFTGAESEITVDVTDYTLRVHDGATPGGNRLPLDADIGAAVDSHAAEEGGVHGIPAGERAIHTGEFEVSETEGPSALGSRMGGIVLDEQTASGEIGQGFVLEIPSAYVGQFISFRIIFHGTNDEEILTVRPNSKGDESYRSESVAFDSDLNIERNASQTDTSFPRTAFLGPQSHSRATIDFSFSTRENASFGAWTSQMYGNSSVRRSIGIGGGRVDLNETPTSFQLRAPLTSAEWLSEVRAILIGVA